MFITDVYTTQKQECDSGKHRGKHIHDIVHVYTHEVAMPPRLHLYMYMYVYKIGTDYRVDNCWLLLLI